MFSAATLLLAVGLVVAVRWLVASWSAQRVVRDARQVPVRELTAGVVRLAGRVRPQGKALATPVGAQPCVFFEVRTAVSSVGFGAQMQQRPPERARRSIPVELTDATGTCTLMLVGAELTVRSARAGVIMPDDALAPIESVGGSAPLPRGLQYEQRWLPVDAEVEVLASCDAPGAVLNALQVLEGGSLLERAQRRVALAAMVAGTLLVATLISLAASLRAVHWT